MIPLSESKTKTSGLANYFCKLKIGVLDIHTDQINSLCIRSWVFDILPRLSMTITDDGSLFELWPLEDNTEITLEIGKNEDSPHIFSSFIVDNYTIDILAGGMTNIVTITAFLKYKDLFHPIHTRSFKKKSSVDVLKSLANEIGLAVDDTSGIQSSDNMSWLQINQNNFDMIKHVLKRSYLSNDLLLAFAEVDTRFVISSLKTAWDSEVYTIARYDLKNAGAESLDDYKNDEDKRTLWSNGYRFESIAGYLNRVGGYGLKGSYYNLIGKMDVSSAIDYHPQTKHSNQNNIGSFVDSINYGSLTDNVHTNYFKGQITNKNLINSSFGSLMTIKINPLMMDQVDMLDIINFSLPSINQKQINGMYGGFYMVVGKTIYASKGHPLQEELSVVRNGLNGSDYKEGKQ